MATFDLRSFNSALNETNRVHSGVDFAGKSLKLDTENDAKDIVAAINACPDLYYLTLTGNTLGVGAAEAIARALEAHPELKVARWSDLFTGRLKTEIPPALQALGDGMIEAGARLKVLDLSDNAFGPIGVEGLAKLLQSDVCSELEELRLNNNGLGTSGARLLAAALRARLPRLRVFVAGRNRLENDGATVLADVFEKMGSLEEVAMPQNGIYHPGILALSRAFKRNPGLVCLNLNDNTIGPKGASAVADALPRLKNLRAINFGDCLLQSKGAQTLARAFRDNSTLIERLDLSHNEIGSVALRALVDSLTAPHDARARLVRVVLAGNRLGNAASKKSMQSQLGSAGELTDDDDDDEEDEDVEDEDEDTDSEESEAESQEGETEDSATEDAQHGLDASAEGAVNVDNSGVEETQNDVERFMREPTLDNLQRLGPAPADVIEAYIESLGAEARLGAYVSCTLCAGGLWGAGGEGAGAGQGEGAGAGQGAARACARRLLARTLRAAPAGEAWPLAERLLAGLALIKSEDSAPLRWHLPGCYALLASALPEPSFPAPLRSTLKFFITSKLPQLPPELRDALQSHPVLVQQ